MGRETLRSPRSACSTPVQSGERATFRSDERPAVVSTQFGRSTHMTAFASFQCLLGRRSRRGTWAYALWFIPYLVTAWAFARELAMEAGARPYQMLPLLIPVLVVAAQLIYPTLLGWTVIFIPWVAFCTFGLYHLIRNATRRPPQWDNNLSGFILGYLFVGACLLVCVCLLFARPRPTKATNAEPGATPNGGPGMRSANT
jgi:hypothetical protein